MPKKRHSNLYSKPPSTVHHVLTSGGSTSTAQNDDRPTVNELLTSLRSTSLSSPTKPAAPVITPSMPQPIRELLGSHNPLPPRPRIQSATGHRGLIRRGPAGPPPPRSWLESSMHAPKQVETIRPATYENQRRNKIDALPGLIDVPPKRSLKHACLKNLAINWETQREEIRYYLYNLPTEVRMLLLSYIAIDGPLNGLRPIDLDYILRPQDNASEMDANANDDFIRLDLSVSIGRSVEFIHLRKLKSSPAKATTPETDSWDNPPLPSLRAPLDALTHLSLAYPPPNISWKDLLNFSKYLGTLTNLSLAYWPLPTLTPNSRTTKMVTQESRRGIDYSTGGFYAHTIDDNWLEAAGILRRLSEKTYSLEWLDFDGCLDWSPALEWKNADEPGVDWGRAWGKVRKICLRDEGVESLDENLNRGISELEGAGSIQGTHSARELQSEAENYKKRVYKAILLEETIRKTRGWIEVVHDDWGAYDSFIEDGDRNAVNRVESRIKTELLALRSRRSAPRGPRNTSIWGRELVSRRDPGRE